MENFEDKYLDVLQNIEFAIVSVYREQQSLLDYEVEQALEAVLTSYRAEQPGRTAIQPSLTPLALEVYERVRHMCELRLGREVLTSDVEGEQPPEIPPLSVDEIVACLKRVRKSVHRWSRRGGRQGYLNFVDEFIP